MNGVSMDGRLTDDMCRVPAGTFRQGSTRSPDEQPVREVQLSAYAIDRMPVTNRAYGEFIKDGGYRDPSLWTPAGWEFIRAHDISEPNYWHDPLSGHPDVPVTGVSGWEALAYARWCGKTLPTEAQWERACRGAAGSTYPWGEDEPDPSLANYAPGGGSRWSAGRPAPPRGCLRAMSPGGAGGGGGATSAEGGGGRPRQWV